MKFIDRKAVAAALLIVAMGGSMAAGQGTETVVSSDPSVALIERLVEWPGRRGRLAARNLARLGSSVVERLLTGLEDRDWRIRAGCVHALGRQGERRGWAPIQRGLDDVSNRIALGTYFKALAAIDPVAAVGVLLPYLQSDMPRIANEAWRALPDVIDDQHRTRLRRLLDSPDAEVRARALELMGRTTSETPWSEFTAVLGDPGARVADVAATTLASRDSDEVIEALRGLVIDGTLRESCYAVLALVRAEDRRRTAFLPDTPEFIKRLTLLLRIRSSLENACGAIGMANISMRSNNATVRSLADKQLMPFLIQAAAGGVMFADYPSIKDLAFGKAELLSGQIFGVNGQSWRTWWLDNRGGFVARRELSTLADVDPDRVVVTWRHRVGGEEMRIVLRGPLAGAEHADGLALGPDDVRSLITALERGRVLEDRGTSVASDHKGDYVHLAIRMGPTGFERGHRGAVPETLKAVGVEIAALETRNRWQYFFPGEGSMAEWRRAIRARWTAATPDERNVLLADLALVGFRRAEGRGRSVAASCFETASAQWREDHAEDLKALLGTPGLSERDIVALVGILGELPGSSVTSAVLSRVGLRGNLGRRVGLSFLRRRPVAEVIGLLEGHPGHVRGLVVRALATRTDAAGVLDALASVVDDGDPIVLDAFRESFEDGKGAVLLPALEKRAANAKAVSRERAIEWMGEVGGDAALDRLLRYIAEGTLPVQAAAIRGLREAATNRSVAEIVAVIEGQGSEPLRLEALAALTMLPPALTAEPTRQLLGRTKVGPRLMLLLAPAAEILSGSLDTDLVPYLQSSDENVSRAVTWLLARRRVKAVVPALIALLGDRTSAPLAQEFIERIACVEDVTTTTDERLDFWKRWWDKHQAEGPGDWFAQALELETIPAHDVRAWLANPRPEDLRAVPSLIRALSSDLWSVRSGANEVLEQISRRSLGTLERMTPPRDVGQLVRRWTKWFHATRR